MSGEDIGFRAQYNPSSTDLTGHVGHLERLIPKARAAQARGEPGIPYMQDEFYRLSLAPGIERAVAINADLIAGNADGMPTVAELDAYQKDTLERARREREEAASSTSMYQQPSESELTQGLQQIFDAVRPKVAAGVKLRQ